MVTEYIDHTYQLANSVQSLLEEKVEVLNPADNEIIDEVYRELVEIIDYTSDINQFLMFYKSLNGDHPVLFAIQRVNKRIIQQTGILKWYIDQMIASMLSLKQPQRFQEIQIELEEGLFKICLSLNQLHTHLGQLQGDNELGE